MTVYVIIAFLCIIIGMVISVSCFGTKGKTPKVFKDIYFSIEDIDGAGVLYTKTGEFSAILAMQNPVQKHCADIDNYYGFSNLLAALMATLGDGYSIHKQDVFTRRQFKCENEGNKEEFVHGILYKLRCEARGRREILHRMRRAGRTRIA